MDWKDKVVIVTGGARGIGAALVDLIVEEGGRAVVVSDRDAGAAQAVADIHGKASTKVVAMPADIADAAAVADLAHYAERTFGQVDIVCSNAGLMTDGGVEVTDEAWGLTWNVNVMAHVRIARAVMPGMIARGSGHFVNVASAAGVLTAPGAAAYTATKHAAVGLAEWMAITYGDQGIGVSVVCPGAVRTDMLAASLEVGNEGVRRVAESSVVMTPVDVARAIIDGVKADAFLITPHADTIKNTQRKWSDVDRWIRGMRSFLRVAA
ncbi:SDR family oxidoreductase [Novosphingobium sp. JCM 18896]|uniref:SDR family oxidoreductase n=1 Tax=Novosphingobium sp. JCM 18896 TaxID=2989731 RepID=UPI00222386EA|nr:SDR family oxidoreductase [Novosphingobium sp. JCM 18896]MCW1432304.1 SDR family oxidoreductase [Novosphingobium sp. JCM 18896]